MGWGGVVGWGVGGGVGWGGVGWDDNVHVPVRAQARQPHHTRAGGGSLSLSLPGGPFWPLSNPNPPKRTYPALPLGGGGVGWGGVGWGGVGWGGVGWGGVGWGGVGWGGVGWDDNVHVPVRTQARQPHHTRVGGGSLSLSLPGGPFWPLSSPNPPKRTYPALPLGGGWGRGWGGGGVRWGGGGMITSMFLCAHRHGNLITRELAVGLCPFLSLVVRFGRSAAQILQNSQPRQLDCAPCSPSGGPFWRIWAAARPKRTTRGRARSTTKQTQLARSVLGGFGLLSGPKRTTRGRARSTAQADQAGEVRFGAFRPAKTEHHRDRDR